MTSNRFFLFLAFVILLAATSARADIYRWDNGEVIPGTEGVEPGPGVQLDNWELEYARLNGLDLSASSWTLCNLESADFFQSQLTGANFESARLRGAVFRETTLTNANMTGALVDHTKLIDVTSHGFTKGQLYSTQSYANKQLQGVFLGGNDLSDWDFSKVDLTDAYFGLGFWDASVLNDTDFTEANLTSAEFRLAGVSRATLTNAIVRGTRFDETDITKEQLYSTASYQSRDLQGISLSYVDMLGWSLAGQNLTGATLYHANLAGADLSRGNLTHAELWESNMEDANLSGAILTDALFGGTDLTNAMLFGADGRGAVGLNTEHALSANMIEPNGQIRGLKITGHELVHVRDYDGGNVAGIEHGPIPLTVLDQLEIGPNAALDMHFESDAWDSLISFEPGIPIQLGGTLELTFADGVDVAAQVNRTFRIFDWTGVEPIGRFNVASNYEWDTVNLYTTGEVTLTAVPEPSSLTLLALGAAGIVARRRMVRR